MEDAGRELRDIRVPLHNGEKTINIRRFAFLQLHFFPKGTRQHLELLFFLLIVRRELLKAFIGELARNVVLIEPLEDSIQLCDPLFGIGKLPFPLCKIPVALPQVTVHDQPHKFVLTAGGEGNDLPQVFQNQFLQDHRADGMGLTAEVTALSVAGAQVVFLLAPEVGGSALIHDRSAVCAEHHAGEHPHFSHFCRTPARLPCCSRGVCDCLRPDRVMGVLKDHPLAFRIMDDLFALVGLLPRLEIDRVPQVLPPAVHDIRYGGGIPCVGQTPLDIACFPAPAGIIGGRGQDPSLCQLSCNLGRSETVHHI